MKESVLLSQIQSIRSKLEPKQAIGVNSQSRWQGRDQISVGQETWRVAQCDSVLELRQRLTEDSTMPLILITALPTAAVGDDVRARLFKEQLIPVDPWNSLAERFKARQVDPALRQSTVLADAALDALGNNEAPVAPSGVLTAEAVWQVILQYRLGLKTPRPDLLDFLPWASSEGAAGKWESLGTSVQTQLQAWLSQSLGDLSPILIRSLTDGYGPDAIAVGLALGALSSAGSDSRAMGRSERFTGNQPLRGTMAQRWNDAAERWAAREPMDRIRQQLGRADKILESLGALESAIDSRWSPLGFQQRLSSFAEQLSSGDAQKCQRAYALVASHEGSRYLEELRGRRERAEMAMRLVRWLGQRTALPLTLPESITHYEHDGSWVDWGRHQLLAGDEPEGVTRSYRRLFDKVTARREEENRRFAELLAASTLSNGVPPGILLIEDVLRTIVAPLAKRCPGGVLFVVMDGMSLPVWRELSLDLSKHGWVEWAPEDGPSYRCALTVLPSATAFSRSSLLSGALVSGAQNLEKRGFQDHADLRSGKPVLFHKDEVGSSGADLSESLRIAVTKNDSKIVGVVLNVIDDSLGGPEQLSIQWNLRSIAVLQALLSEAKSAGRVVILASDHGHVLDHGSKLTRKSDSADRWRPASGGLDVSTDELLVKGTRVLAEGHQIIAPISETARYTANRRLGYHGGLTAQECVAPIAVVAPALMEIEGWEVQGATPPDWWFEGEAALVKERPKAKKTGKKELLKPALPLFETPVSQADWVNALLASDVFAAQMETFAGRLKKEQVEQYLRVLADRNLVLLKSAFAQRLGVSGLRVDGLIASLQRILNVEGYAVLSVDVSQTIRLNLQLLREQFELGESSNGR
jgi:hypothetical protein